MFKVAKDRTRVEQETLVGDVLHKIGQHKGKYPWGTIEHAFECGPYFIVMYTDPDDGEYNFHPYVRRPLGAIDSPIGEPDFRDTNHSYGTLEEALVAAVIFRTEWDRRGINEALNERLTEYVFRALRVEEEEFIAAHRSAA